jgi:signal transduction histidine kinase
MPLVVGDRELGVVTLTGEEQSFPATALVAAAHLVQSMATQLDAALMFDEVRELATVEERHRLARTIHDGIAQELVSVSYALDNALGEPDRDVMSSQIVTARGQLRRILSELRLSIYELRSDKRSTVSLATALSAYVHSIGRDWGMTIHVNATESGARLSSECESELLRIAQEALTNARKHANSSPVDLLVEGAPGEGLTIEVCNRAPVLAGLGPEIPGTGTGLVGLNERATLSGGQLVHGLDVDGDFRLRAWLPWPE